MSITTAFTNNTNQTVTIGGRSIKPGETREVDARFVPASPEINRKLMVLFINLGITPRYFGTTVFNQATLHVYLSFILKTQTKRMQVSSK